VIAARSRPAAVARAALFAAALCALPIRALAAEPGATQTQAQTQAQAQAQAQAQTQTQTQAQTQTQTLAQAQAQAQTQTQTQTQTQAQTQVPPQAIVAACRLPGAEDTVRRMRVPELEIAWRPVAGAIELGRPFSIEFVLCPRLTPAPPIDRITVDAWMPAHRHGMNYRPTLVGTPPAPLRADGLLLHMPGRWEIVFELRAGERMLRLTDGLVLR
jgi:hypothetical protein